MKKILLVSLSFLLLLCGCSTNSKSIDETKVLTPNGATALAFLDAYDDLGEFKVVEGSELLASEFVKDDSQYDIIVAPINMGAKLIAEGQTDYKMAGVLTWGNLYIVENKDVQNGEVYAFGEQAVPGKIIETIKATTPVLKDKKITYFNAVSDVQSQVIAGKCQYAVMAEPAATATIAKAKENGIQLELMDSLQRLYASQLGTNEEGYPQAAVFVKDKESVKAVLDNLETFTKTSVDDKESKHEALLDSIGVETFGMPNTPIVLKSWDRLNIEYKDAQTVKEDIVEMLKLFNIEVTDEMIA